MPRITPKTNWVANNIPIPPDLNRIETNSLQAFTELDAETAARQAAITAEQNARISADNTLQTNIDTANSLRLSGDNIVQGNLNTHIGSTGVHGATFDATANRIVIRDPQGRASFVSPTLGHHAGTKDYIDIAINNKVNEKFILNGIGSMAFLKNITANIMLPGNEVPGSDLRMSNSENTTSAFSNPSGTWQCMGYAGPNTSTLFIRVS